MIKTTREGIVWIGSTTSGVIKRNNGGLLFKTRFNDSHKKLVNRSLQVHESMTKKQAEKAWSEWSEDIKSQRYDADSYLKSKSLPTFKQLAIEHGPWYETACTDYYSSTGSFLKVFDKAKDLTTNPNFEWFVEKHINELGLSDCQQLMDDLKRRYNKSFDVRARYKQAISSVFRYAIEHDLVIENPNKVVRIETKTERQKRKINKRVIALSKSERKATLKAIRDETNETRRILLKLAFATGLRKGELMGLTWDEMVLDDKEPYIKVDHELIEYTHEDQSDQRAEVKLGTKNGKQRVVPLMAELAEDLRVFKSESKHALWEMNDGQQFDFVFCDNKGQYYSLTTPLRWWNTINNELLASGQVKQRITFHKIRATALTMFANDLGLSIDDVKNIAGHSDATVTLKYYVKESQERMKHLGKELSF